MTARILVVDDDPEIRDMLVSSLSFSGFAVEAASDALAALTVVSRGELDAAVLDVMMPGVDGFELVQLIRRRDAALPVLFLSARDTVDDRVRGLRLGGDDYVTKPFSTVEVVARLEALVRRGGHRGADAGSDTLVCADLMLDRSRHLVRRGSDPIELSPTEFRLLELLLENAGRVLSKPQILDAVWQYDFGGDANVVERFVSNLRRKVDDGRLALIHTVRGFGYSLREPDA